MDRYRNFNELRQNERIGIDYDIQMRKGVSGAAIMAPHGGGIEPGIMDIAEGIAGSEHSFYCFRGIKKTGNRILHISSDKFDEPRGRRIAEESMFVLAVHGCSDSDAVIVLGGRDLEFRKRLSVALSRAGFAVDNSPRSELTGTKPTNLCNRGRTGRGGQLELSQGMREQMFDDPAHGLGRRKKFYGLIRATRATIDGYLEIFNKG